MLALRLYFIKLLLICDKAGHLGLVLLVVLFLIMRLKGAKFLFIWFGFGVCILKSEVHTLL